jgi:hypothetical protein
MPQKYFNAIKTKVHFLGVAAIDREIVKEKTGKKNVVTGQDIKKGVVKSETRRITFRDDNFVIDSKSRFADIVESIPFDVDAMIEAITDAIKKELDKSGVSYFDAKKKQDKEEKANIKRIAEAEKKKNDKKEIDAIVEKIVDFFNENKSNVDRIKPVLEKIREYGHKLPSDIDSIEEANDVYKVIEEV